MLCTSKCGCYDMVADGFYHLVAEVMPSEVGVFAALHSRYFGEYAAVLEQAHKAGDVEPKILLALIRAETFIIEQAGDLRTAFFLSGLVERISGVIGKRYVWCHNVT